MVVAKSQSDPFNEGYPPSSEADLDPGPDVSESLDDADRSASDEHRVAPEHRRRDPSMEADRFEDVDTLDDAAPGD